MGKSKKKDQERNHNNGGVLEERFRAAETRPQFRPIKKQTTKVVLDERFASVLTDERFQLQGRDKYGRKNKEKVKDELSAFYTVEDDEEIRRQPKQLSESGSSSSDSEDDSKDGKSQSKEDENPENDDPATRIAYLTAFSRGQLDVSSSSSDEDSSQSSDDDAEEEGEDPVYGTAGVLDPSNKEEDITITDVPSPYLAVMNMDWEHIRAVDLFAIFSSFTAPGAVKKVQVYQSDFGIERMEKDKIFGPTEILQFRSLISSKFLCVEVGFCG